MTLRYAGFSLSLAVLWSCAEESSAGRKAAQIRAKQGSVYSGSENAGEGNGKDKDKDKDQGKDKDKDLESGKEGTKSGTKTPVVIDITKQPLNLLPATLAELNIYSPKGVQNAKIPFLNYDVNAPLWSDGADKSRSILIPKGTALTAAPVTGNIVFPNGTILVKHFTSPVDKSPIETRVILRRPNATWDFATYRWAADGSTKRVTAPEVILPGVNLAWPNGYRIPGEAECIKCHNPYVTDVLGFRPDQLKGVLEKLSEQNIIAPADLETFKKATAIADAKDKNLSPEVRAKAYLAVNCANCHQVSGIKSSLSLHAKSLDWPTLLKTPATMTGEVLADSPIITPGAPEKSKLYLRFVAKEKRMPGVSVVQDPVGEEVIKAWIMSIPSTCTVTDTATCSPADMK